MIKVRQNTYAMTRHGKMMQSNALQDKIKEAKIRQSIGYAPRASEQQIVKSKTKLNKARQGKAISMK